MKVYINSSLSHRTFGSIARGWQDSDLIAERANTSKKDASDFFKTLLTTGQATEKKAMDAIETSKKKAQEAQEKAQAEAKKKAAAEQKTADKKRAANLKKAEHAFANAHAKLTDQSDTEPDADPTGEEE